MELKPDKYGNVWQSMYENEMNTKAINNTPSLNFMPFIDIDFWEEAPVGSIWQIMAKPRGVEQFIKRGQEEEHYYYYFKLYNLRGELRADSEHFHDYLGSKLSWTGTIMKLGETKFMRSENIKGCTLRGTFHKVLASPEDGRQEIGWVGNDVIVYLRPCQ